MTDKKHSDDCVYQQSQPSLGELKQELWEILKSDNIRLQYAQTYIDYLCVEALEEGSVPKHTHCSSCKKKRRFKKNPKGVVIAICDTCVAIIFRGDEPSERQAPHYYVRENRKKIIGLPKPRPINHFH